MPAWYEQDGIKPNASALNSFPFFKPAGGSAFQCGISIILITLW